MLFLLLLACRAERPTEGDVVYDGEGLPDCAATYTEVDLCDALKAWTSSEVDGFDDDGTGAYPIRWIGTEVQPAFCADDPDEAEAWVLDLEPDQPGARHDVSAGERWTDIRRWDADDVYQGPQRVMRCDFLTDQAATPPGTEPVPDFATYAAPIDIETDFFPVAREITRWRQDVVTLQVVLSYGEVHTESAHLRVCSVRCGICEDNTGVANVTAVLEKLDWRHDPDTLGLSFDVEPQLTADCQIR